MFEQVELGVVKLNIEYNDNISELRVFNNTNTELKIFNGEEAKLLFMILLGQEGIEIEYDDIK